MLGVVQQAAEYGGGVVCFHLFSPFVLCCPHYGGIITTCQALSEENFTVSNKNKKNIRLNTQVDQPFKKALGRASATLHMSESEFVRQAVLEKMMRMEKNDE